MIRCRDAAAPAEWELRGTSAGWVGGFLLEAARSLAVSPRGAGLLVRQDSRRDAVVLVPDRAGVEAGLVDLAGRAPGRVRLAPVGPRSEVGVGDRRWFVGLCPPRGPPLSVPRDGPRPEARAAPRAPNLPVEPFRPFEPVPPYAPPAGVALIADSHWRSEAPDALSVRLRACIRLPHGRSDEAVHGVVLRWVRRAGDAGFSGATARWAPDGGAVARAWDRGSPATGWPSGAFRVESETAVREVSLPAPSPFPTADDLLHHTVVVGASGSGKSGWLAAAACSAIEGRVSVVVLDVHGDLGEKIAAGLGEEARDRLVILDPSDDRAVRSGIRVLGSTSVAAEVEAAHLVAALKRLTSDAGETFWGFRMERVFDTFVRRVQEEGGTLVDLFDLLTDPSRRDAARLATSSPDIARFLDELPTILARNPEYLAPAAARVAKVVARASLARLLAPSDDGLPVDELLDRGRAIVLRLPVGSLGPEASSFAATLLLSRLYLGRTNRPVRAAPRLSTLVVVDEASSVSARLLGEILAEGRKFGVGLVLATQYPERLPPELRAAAGGAAGNHLAFRTPPPNAVASGAWVGLPASDAVEILPQLPTGVAVLSTRSSGRTVRFHSTGPPAPPIPGVWGTAVRATAAEFSSLPESEPGDRPGVDEAVLMAVLGLEALGRPRGAAGVARWVAEAPGGGTDPTVVPFRLPILARRGWLSDPGADGYQLTEAGRRRLAGDGRTGASRESAEHRALLVDAFEHLASRGYRMEILRQGRFDTRLPDGRLSLLPRGALAGSPPSAAARVVDAARAGWAWRFFGGRDVHFEAEVSGATRRDRIRRDVEKAQHAGAFLVVLVADAGRARHARRFLRELGAGPDRAQVWTLPKSAATRVTADPGAETQGHLPVRST
jgi:DNA helicase HerA-like ATPase